MTTPTTPQGPQRITRAAKTTCYVCRAVISQGCLCADCWARKAFPTAPTEKPGANPYEAAKERAFARTDKMMEEIASSPSSSVMRAAERAAKAIVQPSHQTPPYHMKTDRELHNEQLRVAAQVAVQFAGFARPEDGDPIETVRGLETENEHLAAKLAGAERELAELRVENLGLRKDCHGWNKANSRQIDEIRDLRTRLLAAEQREGKLREALTPFAKYACSYPHVGEAPCHNCVARAALTQPETTQ